MESSLGLALSPQPATTFPAVPGLGHIAAWLAAVIALGFAGHAADGIGAAKPAEPAARIAPPSPAPVATAPRPPTLGSEMRRALDYTARRYRLSTLALEPAFIAAERHARELGLDPLLVVAVIGIESSFNPFAESVMGAQGLMQVIPRYHADKLPPELRHGAAAGLAFFDPVINVRVGVKALHEYIRNRGDVADGLQQFAGAQADAERGYAAKVLAELERLEIASRRKRPPES